MQTMTAILRMNVLFAIAAVLLGPPLIPGAPAFPEEDYCAASHQDVSTPLNDLGSQVYVRMDGQNTGYTGGLYPGGSNIRPLAHEQAGINIAMQIQPLDPSGDPNPLTGKIVMISIGMSNTGIEFSEFITQASADPEVNPRLVLVNGAQPGQTSNAWLDPNALTWLEVNRRLEAMGLTTEQVQVAWVKQTRVGPGNFPNMASAVQGDLETIVRNLKTNYPNIRIAYLSSRTRSYTYWNGLSPEPAAYENGFAVKWLIEDQINGDHDLNFDPARGPVVAPYLSWGAYLWIDGLNPRSDGLIWSQQDMVSDCTHPSTNGRLKVAQMLMDFFKHDTTTRWFGSSSTQIHYLPVVFSGN